MIKGKDSPEEDTPKADGSIKAGGADEKPEKSAKRTRRAVSGADGTRKKQETDTDSDLDGISLEEALVQLDAVMDQMEQGDISLEESFQLYQRGMQLVKHCSDSIDKVEKQLLVLEENGV